MVSVEFYYDPSCPFCWITSRWLLQVQAEREIGITWRQFSLALKNNELQPSDEEGVHAAVHRDSHRIQRIICKATAEYGASGVELYSEFGIRFHIMEKGAVTAPLQNVSIYTTYPILSLQSNLLHPLHLL